MKALFFVSARLAIFGLCLIAALAAACSFDTSQLRTLPDGASVPPDLGTAKEAGARIEVAPRSDAAMDAPPVQDAEVTSALDVGPVRDGALDPVADRVVGPSSDGSPDRAPDVAQDVAWDAATDLPSGLCVPPAVPTGVAATANNSNGSIAVSWGPVTGATGYTVSRGTSASGPFTAVSTNQTAATYADSTGLTAGTTYYYVVSANDAGGTCASGNSTPAVSARSCSLPSAPSGVSATAGISRVTVSWTASTGGPTSYEVKRGNAAGGPFTSIGTPTASPYVDSGVTNGTTYYYVVAARNAGGVCSSANSAVASTAPRSCTVVSGAVAMGHTAIFNTLGGLCFVTCDTVTGWGCSNTAGRSLTINGGPLGCGALPIPAAKTPGFNVIDVTAGTSTIASIYWWGTWSTTCTIPSGGLDF